MLNSQKDVVMFLVFFASLLGFGAGAWSLAAYVFPDHPQGRSLVLFFVSLLCVTPVLNVINRIQQAARTSR